MPAFSLDWEDISGHGKPEERYRIYRLTECPNCNGTGKSRKVKAKGLRCSDCRGEGNVRELVATCETPGDVGEAIVRLGREGEFKDSPIGLLDTMGDLNQKWIVKPWQPSPRQISDAGRVLARSRWK